MDKWEECQDLIEHIFGEKPESPMELVQIMICMADKIVDLEIEKGERSNSQKLQAS